MNPIDGFTVDPAALRFVGHDLQRPECVLAAPDGALLAADARGGAMRIDPDGGQRRLQPAVPAPGSLPNGLAFDADGALLVADIGLDRLDRLHPDGRLETVVDRLDGRPLGKANFVLHDRFGRCWLTVSTRRAAWLEAVHPDVADGYVAVGIGGHWRIVADGLAFANELRLDAGGRWLYVVETCGPRISRFPVAADGTLGPRETFGPERHDAFIDGIAFDAHGNLWGTHVFRDRIFALTPDGEMRTLLDAGGDPRAHDRLMQAFAAGRVAPEMFTAAQGAIAPGFTSLAFCGADRRTVVVGSIGGRRLPCFRAPVAGVAPR